jgi:Ca2+-transporting ATPase
MAMIEPVHHIEGRTRYRIEGLQGSPGFKRALESALLGRPEIISASASDLTGKLLICYNSANTKKSMSDTLESLVLQIRDQAKHARADTSPPAHPPFSRRRRSVAETASSSEEGNTLPVWYRMASKKVLRELQTSGETGLSFQEAETRRGRLGANVLPEMEKPSQFAMFADQLKTLPVGLLAVAAGLSAGTGAILDAALIMGVVALNAVIGFATESKAEKTISSLKTLVKPTARVIRGGKESTVAAEQVVAGDILVLKPGTYITADSRVLSAAHLSVDESALTGESLPVYKAAEALRGKQVPLADRTNMVFTGTLVTGGQGLAVVTATGRHTEIGRLQQMVGGAQTPQTPLEKQLNQVGNQLVAVSGGICGMVFVLGLARGYCLLQMLRTAISLAAAAVPEGLPAVATTTLAFGMNNLRRHHVLIRKLGAVETLGSVQTICLDKTGTITLNHMSVVSVYADNKTIHVRDGKFSFHEAPFDPVKNETLLRLLQVCVLCSDTKLAGLDNGEGEESRSWQLRGSPTENALVQVAIDAGVDPKEIRKRHPLLQVAHRSENRLYMSTLHESDGMGRFIALKGSPAEVLDMCVWQLAEGKAEPLTDAGREQIQIENERMAVKALRVLGLAYAPGEHREKEKDGQVAEFVWLGLVGMADPVRKGVNETIGAFHRAGIKTVMLTGDQSPTAYAVSKELDLSQGREVQILESSYLEEMDPDTLQALVQRVHVFARISPSHKLQIVQALQNAGQVIAMTGDGINDSPALKSADIGIAMGGGGTDIAREVADVVLEKDDLETLVIAIEGGRSIYENIRKAVHFLTATNLSEIMVTFACIGFGMGQPLNAMQLLWINTISDIFPALALSMAPPEPDVMNRPPRRPEQRIIENLDLKRMAVESGVITAGAMGAYGYGTSRYGLGPRASTLAFQGLTLGQLLHTLSCKSEAHSIFKTDDQPRSAALNMAVGGSLALQGLTMVVPGLRRLLGLAPINLSDIGVIGASAVLPFLINEATKNIIYVRNESVREGDGL